MLKFIAENSDIFEKISESNAFLDRKRVETIFRKLQVDTESWNLTRHEKKAVLNKQTGLPKLRGQAKMHKADLRFIEDIKFRPIIGSDSSVLTNLSKLLDLILRPIADKMKFRLQDTFKALEWIEKMNLDDYYLVPIDAVGLSTHISHDLAQK